ncbi:MAG: IS66 family transposase [Pseudomonadales bacterium]|nr:IS66 family transposase [Pseudomonadales bacterium]
MNTASRIAELEQTNAQLTVQMVAMTQKFGTELGTLKQQYGAEIATLKQQLDWFKRQLFGQKSEKQLVIDPAVQGNLLDALGVLEPPQKSPPPPEQSITYTRQRKVRDAAVNDSGLRFGPDVTRDVVTIVDPAIAAVPEDRRELVSERVSYRRGATPGQLRDHRVPLPDRKLVEEQRIVSTPAPASVLERCVADVSLLAGMLVDKFCYHLPLYRQHQRIAQCGIQLSRTSLSNWSGRAIDLLRPIAAAQHAHILLGSDRWWRWTRPRSRRTREAGQDAPAYLWPIYGEDDEIVFHYAPTRAHHHVEKILGPDFRGTLLSDGYAAYSAYAARKGGVTHASCWAHCRRGFEQAQDAEPQAAAEALAMIAALYRHEQIIREQNLDREHKLAYRTQHSEPIVDRFWHWCDDQCHRMDLLPSNPLAKAIQYAKARVTSLRVFLSDPDVPIDTNHLERSLRAVPMGRRNWLFCWTEVGAERVAVIQSLLVSCRLQGVDPYTYLVDVLQRISVHPASRAVELTPREWKARFAHDPMKSILACGKI